MRVTSTRPLRHNGQVIRRRRECTCGITFQTEERPRLWIKEGEQTEPFLRGVLLASIRTAARGVQPAPPDERLQNVVHQVVARLLSEGELESSRDAVRQRTADALLAEGLDEVAYRYEPSRDPEGFLVAKQGRRDDESFDRDKLLRSIMAASSKFLSIDEAGAVVTDIEDDLGGTSGRVDTEALRELVSRGLRSRDERAFLRYALGARHNDCTLDDFLQRVAPTVQVRKRDGSVVLFDGTKLGKSIRRSFLADRRDAQAQAIAGFVEGEEGRVRRRMAAKNELEATAQIGKRVLVWLFAQDELAWANYWLAFEHDDGLATSPVQQLAEARERMRALVADSSAPRAAEARAS
jgi:transcriptional regulator NrdR family protein